MASKRTGNDSRCCTPADPPLLWIDITDTSHQAVEEYEEWLASLAPFERAHQQGRIDSLLGAASKGELFDSDDHSSKITPVRRDPDIYELRYKALTKRLRFYHGEPPHAPNLLYRLHRHIKKDKTDQDAQIDHAQRVYAPVSGRKGPTS